MSGEGAGAATAAAAPGGKRRNLTISVLAPVAAAAMDADAGSSRGAGGGGGGGGGGSPAADAVVLAPDSLAALRDAGVRAIVWDFDLTILAIHSYAKRITVEAVAARDLGEDFRDLRFFTSAVRALAAAGFQVAIASFGRYEVIQAYLDRAFDTGEGAATPRYFVRHNIITPSTVGGADGCTLKGGKNTQLAYLGEAWRLAPHQFLFFDGAWGGHTYVRVRCATHTHPHTQACADDVKNIELSTEAGYQNSVHVPEGFHGVSWGRGLTMVRDHPAPTAAAAAAATAAAAAAVAAATVGGVSTGTIHGVPT